MDPLDEMSMELHAFVLKQLPSPRDVLNAISTSANYLRAFRLHRRRILEAIMPRAWADLLPDAICAQHASNVGSRDSRMKDWQFARSRNPVDLMVAYDTTRRKRTTWYVEDRHRAGRTTDIYSEDVLVGLWQLWFYADWFVEDYCRRTFAKLQEFRERRTHSPDTTPDLDVKHAYPLSQGERDRLTRAFLRFETYRRIFSGPDQHVWDPANIAAAAAASSSSSSSSSSPFSSSTSDNATLPHSVYLNRWWKWELEEIHAVHDYLKDRLEEVFDNLENLMVEKLRNATESREASHGEPTDQHNLENLGFGIFQRSRKGSHDRQMAYLMELGLPFLKALFDMNLEDQLTLVTSTFAQKSCVPSLEDNLRAVSGPPDLSREDEEDPMDSVNVGWLLVLARADSNVRWQHGLRQLGHVFWDPVRSQKADLADIPADQYDTLPQRRERSEEPSVEDRIEGLMIRPGALEGMRPEPTDPADVKMWVDNLDY